MITHRAPAAADMVGASVRLKGVTKRYGNVVAVDSVSLEVERGSFVTLLGPSGSGKTTTLMMVAGFVVPTSGEIYVDDQLIIFDPPFKRNLGMVFQNYALFPHMTVAANVAFPLKMRRLPRPQIRHRVARALELVHLDGLGDRYPRQLSGGQQQRVALARTLVYSPRVLLMDEPLGALDKKLRQQMQLEIRHLHDQLGITVIYVTHDQEEALTMSDKIVVMHAGRIEQVGVPSEVYHAPHNHFVADFVGETNFLNGRIVAVDGTLYRVRTLWGLEVHVAARPGFTQGQAVTLAIRPERVRFAQVAKAENVVPARIEELVFVGDATRYLLRLESGESLILKVANDSRTPNRGQKEEVEVTIGANDILLLPAQESEGGDHGSAA